MSKKSSVNPTLFTFKNAMKSPAIWAALLLFAGLTVFIPFGAFSSLRMIITLEDGAPHRAAETLVYHFGGYISDFAPILFFLVAGAGGLIALLLFKFITSKKTVNIYYSLGIKREKLFTATYLAGAIMIFTAIFVPITAAYVINIIYCGFSKYLLNFYLYTLLKFLSCAFLTFSAASAIFSAVGTIFEAILFTATIVFAPFLYFHGILTAMEGLFYGMPIGSTFNYINDAEDTKFFTNSESVAPFEPIFYGSDYIRNFYAIQKSALTTEIEAGTSYVPLKALILPIIWLVIAFIFFFVGLIVFKKRKAEICGFIGANKYLNAVVIFSLSFFASCYSLYFGSGHGSNTFPIIISLTIFTVVFFILEIVIKRDKRKIRQGLKLFPVGFLITLIVGATLSTSCFGLGVKAPKIEKIKEVAISMGGTKNEYGYEDDFSDYGLLGKSDYFDLVSGFKSEEDIKAIIDIHNIVVKNHKMKNDDIKYGAPLKIAYTLKNGKKVYRQFDYVPYELMLTQLMKLEKSDLFQDRLQKIFVGDMIEPTVKKKNLFGGFKKTYDVGEEDPVVFIMQQAFRSDKNGIIFMNDGLKDRIVPPLSLAQRNELSKNLYKDLKDRTMDEKYFLNKKEEFYISVRAPYVFLRGIPDKIIKGKYLNFIFDISEEGNYNMNEVGNTLYWTDMDYSYYIRVTDDMTNTINFVKSLGIYNRLKEKPKFVEAYVCDPWSNSLGCGGSLVSAKYYRNVSDYYLEEALEYDLMHTKKQSEIDALYDVCLSSAYVKHDEYYPVVFKYSDGTYVSLCLKTNLITPELLKKCKPLKNLPEIDNGTLVVGSTKPFINTQTY